MKYMAVKGHPVARLHVGLTADERKCRKSEVAEIVRSYIISDPDRYSKLHGLLELVREVSEVTGWRDKSDIYSTLDYIEGVQYSLNEFRISIDPEVVKRQSSEALDARVASFAEQMNALERLKPQLIEDLANAFHDRLIERFESRSDEDKKSWPEFDAWLSAHIEYDMYSVYVVTNRDSKLKQLLEALDQVDRSVGRPTASQLINKRLKETGHSVGLNQNLISLEDLRDSPFASR